MRNVSYVALLGSIVIACSDPGGGGGGVFVDATADGMDVSFVDVGGDVATPGDVAGACTNGERRCAGQVAQQCVNGAFQDLFECPSTQICEAGACRASEVTNTETSDTSDVIVPPDPCLGKECGPDGLGGSCGTCDFPDACSPQGQCVQGCTPDCTGKECGSDLCGGTCGSCGAFEQCVQGQCEQTEVCDCAGAVCGLDNCGNSCGTCTGQTTCSGGRCVSIAQGGTCVDLIDCIYDQTLGCFLEPDEPSFQACVDACYAASSDTGIAEFEAYLGCLQGCPEPDGDPNTTADDLAYDRCAYQNCSDEEAFCVLETSGANTCFGIVDCYSACADGDDACVIACYEGGSPAAQAAIWGISNCLSVECPSGDDLCIEAALQDQCLDHLIACENN